MIDKLTFISTTMVLATEVRIQNKDIMYSAFHIGEHAWVDHHFILLTGSSLVPFVGVVLEACNHMAIAVKFAFVGQLDSGLVDHIALGIHELVIGVTLVTSTDWHPVVGAHIDVGSKAAVEVRF